MAAEHPDPYQGWREDFGLEVNRVMKEPSGSQIAPVKDALSDFDAWWRTEVPDTDDEESIEVHHANKELDVARTEIRVLKEAIERLSSDPDKKLTADMQTQIASLAADKKRLEEEWEERAARLEYANEELRARNAHLERELADNQIKMSRQRDDYDARTRQLEERSARLEDQLRDAKESRSFVESEMARQRVRFEELEKRFRAGEGDKDRYRQELHDMVRKLDAMEKQAADADTEKTALEFAAEELRRQTTELRERLIKSSAALHSDRSDDRSQLRALAKKGEELENRITAEQKESEAKVRETTRYLEMKIREIHDENKEQFGRFRELLDALVRFRGGAR